MNTRPIGDSLLLIARSVDQGRWEMPMAVVLISGQIGDVLTVEAAQKLAQLGITGVTVLGDQDTLALVLEGWAFDPATARRAAEAVLPVGAAHSRLLATQFHVSVRGAT